MDQANDLSTMGHLDLDLHETTAEKVHGIIRVVQISFVRVDQSFRIGREGGTGSRVRTTSWPAARLRN